MGNELEEVLVPDKPVGCAASSMACGSTPIMLLGAAICTLANSFVHSVHTSLPALIQGRYLIQWVVALLALLLRSRAQGCEFRPFGPPGQRRWLLFRGVVYYGFIWLWWETLKLVPLGDAVAVVKFEVFVSGLASAAFFGERLTGRWLLCCTTSLLGVVLVARPPFLFGGSDRSSTLGRFLNVLTPLVGGMMPCLIKLAPEAHFLEVQHACDFVTGVIMSPVVTLSTGAVAGLWQPEALWSILAIAVLGMAALCAFTLAYQRGQIGRVALVGYAEVPFAYLMQTLVFGAGVELSAVLGAALVVLSAVAASMEQQELKSPAMVRLTST